jgi:DNA-binding LacI/PurR family transcriptional regulator
MVRCIRILVNVKVTSHDVARLAGVSQPTVSRALRNLPGTSQETRAKVLAAARELAYIPSETGRSLSTRTTRRVAVVAEELTNPFYPELVEPLRLNLSRHGFRTVLITDHVDDPVEVEALADGSFDGVVLTTALRGSPVPRALRERRIPHVLANRTVDEPGSSSASTDNRRGAALVADLLASLGHKRIGAVFGPTATSTGRERASGLRERLRRHGIGLDRDLVRRVPFTHEAGAAAAADLLAARHPPTAIACGNDVVATGVLSAARAVGVRVPEELTVIGFDDISLASWDIVSLTTVRCDLASLARVAVELLARRIAAPDSAVSCPVLAPSLVLRGTHARCR